MSDLEIQSATQELISFVRFMLSANIPVVSGWFGLTKYVPFSLATPPQLAIKTQHIPYPFAHVPPAIPPRYPHSVAGRQFPVSPDGMVHPPGPHFTTVTSGRTEERWNDNLKFIMIMPFIFMIQVKFISTTTVFQSVTESL
jgi:hypothetical protein